MSLCTPIFSDAKWPLFPFLYFSFPDLPKMELLKEVDESMTHLRNSQCQIEANAKVYTVKSWIEGVLLFYFLNFKSVLLYKKIYVVKNPWNHIFACFYSNLAFIRDVLLFTTLRYVVKRWHSIKPREWKLGFWTSTKVWNIDFWI